MEKTILTKHQATILDHLSWEKDVHENFYLSGGTALAEFYLHHRLSEDLDFFSEKEFDPQVIQVVLKKIQKKVKLKKIDFQQSFNRNLFFLSIGNDIVKTEFTYFPFSPITNGMNYNELRIDSLLDIAVNKVFTIYQKPRSRDFIDLYCILQKERWPFENLIKKEKIKFRPRSVLLPGVIFLLTQRTFQRAGRHAPTAYITHLLHYYLLPAAYFCAVGMLATRSK